MDINQITALQVAQLSEQDYENLMKTIKRARDIRAQHKMNQFNVGDEVSFMDKQGRKQMGQIQTVLMGFMASQRQLNYQVNLIRLEHIIKNYLNLH